MKDMRGERRDGVKQERNEKGKRKLEERGTYRRRLEWTGTRVEREEELGPGKGKRRDGECT